MPVPDDDSNHSALERFLVACTQVLQTRHFDKVLLSGYRGPVPDLKRVTLRAIELRGEPHLSFVYSHERRDLTKNLATAEGLVQLRALLGPQGFCNAHLHTPHEELQLALSRKGRWSLRTDRHAAAVASAPAMHNREKHRLLTLDRPFLAALGVTDAEAALVPAMARKWKQINQLRRGDRRGAGGIAAGRRSRASSVLDFGSGKGYLTFAMHDYLRHALGLDAQVIGVELRDDMVELCNGGVGRLGLHGLRFEQGDVRSYAPARWT